MQPRGMGVVELIERLEHGPRQIGHRPSGPAESDDDLFIGDRRQCLDHLGGGLSAEQRDQARRASGRPMRPSAMAAAAATW